MLYFSDFDKEKCTDIETILDLMEEKGITRLEINEAKRVTGTKYLFCKAKQEEWPKEWCGSFCPSYKPNNGKNGRCKHYGYLYKKTEKTRTIQLELQ